MFKNHIGQVIVPGDDVIVVSTGYSNSVSCRQGIFSGMSSSGNPQVQVDRRVTIWTDDLGKISARLPYPQDRDRVYTHGFKTQLYISTFPSGRIYKLAM